ncbi:hypothetical protein [Cohnella mopanensis]|uniref:hypothetical protein n=1 Tax=Cohnella mopanensis TaxID=2911966 RepID=UPI001EF84B38|nr:hypothetical protein [Cohnella mopanensis]
MNNLRARKVFLSLICVLMLFSIVNPVYGAGTVQKTKTLQPQKLGTVTLKANVTAEVNNLVMIPSNNGQLLSMTLTVKNNSNSELNFIDYWLELYTKSGTKYSLTTSSKDIGKIAAKSSKDIVFFGQVGSNIKLTDLLIKVIKWDFSVASYTRVLGNFTVPQKYIHVTPANYSKVVSADDTKISFLVKQSNIGKSEKYYRPDIKIAIKNEGKRLFTLPEYEIAIQTSDGLLYPLTAKNLKGTALSPLSEKEFQLSTSIPLEAKQTGWKMVVILPVNEGKDKIPLALFNLPKATVESVDEIGKVYNFANTDGVYYISLDSMNRLPLEDNDLVISNLTLFNKGTESLVIPSMTGKILFNDSVEKPITVSNNTKQISIQPGTSIKLQAIAKVPYTFDIAKMKFTLQQKESTSGSEGELVDLIEFTNQGKFAQIRTADWNKGYEINDIGYRANVNVKHMMTYKGTNADLAVALVSLTSLEKRMAEIQQFAGYFEKADGTTYPAKFLNVSDKIPQGGKALIYAVGSVPKGSDTSNMKLIIGRAITETKQSSTGQTGQEQSELVGYVDPVSIALPAERIEKKNLQKIDLDPYELSINFIATYISFVPGLMKLNMDYTLEQNLLAKTNAKDQKLIFEIVDADGKTTFTKEVPLPSDESTGKDENSMLLIGKNSFETSWTDERFVLKIQLLKDFTFNVYHQVQPGYKKLVATQTIPWMVNRTLEPESK